MRQAKLGDFLAKKSRGIIPGSTPQEMFELYSVPAFDTKRPEIVSGAAIGSNKQIVEPGTVLLCKINPRINRAWTVGQFSDHQRIASTEWITFPPHPDVEPRFLAHYLSRKEIRDYLAANASGVGGSLMRVKPSTVEDVPIALPDIFEQRRIVAELEKHFSRLDEAESNLRRVKANLLRYKAAVLNAAVEGRLVAPDGVVARDAMSSIETGSMLLNRIHEERQRANAETRKYKAPVAPDTLNLPKLPKGWTWTSLDALSWQSSYGTSAKCTYENGGTPVLRIPNVQNGTLDLGDLKFAPPDAATPPRAHVSSGDMLVIRTNGSRKLVGRAAVVLTAPSLRLSFASYLIRFRLVNIKGLAEWVSIVWQGPRMRAWIEGHAATSAGQHNISQSVLATAAIPLPPLGEMNRLVAEVGRRLDYLGAVDGDVDKDVTRIEFLRRAILNAQFGCERQGEENG